MILDRTVFTSVFCGKKCSRSGCLTLCHPMDCSLPGSSIHGISQSRILEWVAISFSRESHGFKKKKIPRIVLSQFFGFMQFRRNLVFPINLG